MKISDLAAAIAGGAGFWYLATPYSKYPTGHEAAFKDASIVAAALLERNIHLFCPIAHSHPLAVYGKMDKVDHNLWLALDEKVMEACQGIIVAKLPGWHDSFGVTFEREYFHRRGQIGRAHV